MKRIRPWTTLEVRRLLDLRSQRYSLAGLARALNRTVGSVSMKLSLLRATRPYPRKRRKRGGFLAAVARLCAPGVSDRDVAKRLGTTRQEVYRARTRLGIPAGLTPAEGGSRNRGVKRCRPVCWCCGSRCPYPTVRRGWPARTVLRSRASWS